MQSEDRNVPDDAENGDSNAIVIAQSEDRSNVSDDAKNGDSTTILIATSKEQQWGHKVDLNFEYL